MQEQDYAIYRDLRSWTAALTFRVRNNPGAPQDFTVAFTFWLKAFRIRPWLRDGPGVPSGPVSLPGGLRPRVAARLRPMEAMEAEAGGVAGFGVEFERCSSRRP